MVDYWRFRHNEAALRGRAIDSLRSPGNERTAHKGMKKIKRILLTGGGTAGHVNPALAIGSALADKETSFLFVGVRGKVEEMVVPREGIPIKYVRASGFSSGLSLKMAGFVLNLAAGILQSLAILLRFRPDVIVGTGAYVSAPIIMAAAFLRKLRLLDTRVYLHEQNAVPGKLNRLMGRFADRVLVTFPETVPFFPERSRLVGYPLRKRVTRISREEARAKVDLPVPEGRKVVLVFGGSQGSRVINRAIVDALGRLRACADRLFIVHGVGLFRGREYDALSDTEQRLRRRYSEEELRELETFYACRPFFYNIEYFYSLSDLVVARAGAGSLNEISAMGLPALIIPKSNLPGDHQIMNARSMERTGGAEIVYEQVSPVDGRLEEWIDGNVLAEKIIDMLADDDRLREMGMRGGSFLNHDALERISRVIHGKEDGDAVGAGVREETARIPGNRALLSMLEKAHQKQQSKYSPEQVVSRRQDLDCFRSRAGALLLHTAWQQRNLGVKLLGLLHAHEKIPALLALFNDRTRVSLLKRLCGGDFEQV
ncbi:MAG TPA: UDP-N-acetylglucosamine--N-acetylmuramyl-(pentapeptide) pyrophosphoryl-undecaprenol N-acetylglucosamine transferase, partial [Acidobacteriota bacterium]|nr:UDP-N-acetylglucosamine--N-acetylmuramyl-(pentapeptide) pyrophosphoryl-undecaprenol N-acetylglucosamine transferase [Acidobacteriota bacterium]